jgi:UDP-N-acetylglucosamine--N-acetylmuramyl-(pentapeptide) pyrophosphoryl-undecaprenol N-acetylglucosamine transferase
MAVARPILLAAGGTGGHLFPAEALANALARHGVPVHLATDERASKYGTSFPALETHEIRAATVSGRSPLAMASAVFSLGQGLLQAYGVIGRVKPAAVVGFGGYPTVPPVLAGVLRGVPTLIHEQNAVLGRANKLLAPRVGRIATGFASVKGIDGALAAKARHVGNPVRPAVIAAAATPFADPVPGGPLRLCVFGGSQGARVMSDIVPPTVALLGPDERRRLSIVQQAREEDLARVRDAYAAAGVEAEIAPFFRDLPSRIAAAHLVVARSGASTVAELGVIGRPSILVPLPHALDQDQAGNAESLSSIGAADVIRQADFTPAWLAGTLKRHLAEPQRLTQAAAAAKSAGIPDAAERLAALVLEAAGLPRLETAA